jgi:hypothetical protein
MCTRIEIQSSIRPTIARENKRIYIHTYIHSYWIQLVLWRNNPLLDNWLLKHVSRRRTPLEESTRCPKSIHGSQDNKFIKHNNGTLGGSDLYDGRVAFITGSTFRELERFRVEAGSNTSTVALREIGGDKGRSLESETVKYGRESHGTRTREWLRWRGPAAVVNDRPVVNYKVCDLAIALYLFVVTICKYSINPITNLNSVYSHSYTK